MAAQRRRPFLNADVGEGLESDKQLIPFLDQASVACGGHFGDRNSMRSTVELCLKHSVSIGAHPSYADRVNFGRLSLSITGSELETMLFDQLEQFQRVCEELGAKIDYIKPHGALYHDVMQSPRTLALLLRSASVINDTRRMPIMLMPLDKQRLSVTPAEQSNDREVAVIAEFEQIREAFADRKYVNADSLVDRSQHGAVMINAKAIFDQAQRLMNGQPIKSMSGEDIFIEADSICLHGDNPASVEAAERIVRQFES